MKLVITEKNDAAEKIARLLAVGAPKADKVYNTPVYRFQREGEEWVTIGLRGHILEPDFAPVLTYDKDGWHGVTAEGVEVPARVPDTLPRPPFRKKKPFTEDAVELKSWKMEALPYLIYAPVEKLPKEKDIIRSLKNLAKKADGVVIATDFDREGELIGSDALGCVLEANPGLPATRARYSAFTAQEIQAAFADLVELDTDLASAGASRRDIDLIWGAVLTRFLTIVKFSGYGNVRSSGRVQTPTLALICEREAEREAFVPTTYWVCRGMCDTQREGDGPFPVTHEEGRITDPDRARAVMDAIEGETTGRVIDVEKKRRRVPAPVPFNTTALQAAAAAEGISPARTMRIAESLYMSGYISYPRVDNTVYPASLDLRECVSTLAKNPAYAPVCRELLARPKLTATRGKKETTDHPPIYPTAAATPDDLAPADFKLYNLIARRFLATLSDAAEVEGTKARIDVGGEAFVAKGDVLVRPGFRAIYPYGLKRDEQLPALAAGDTVAFTDAECLEKQTEPPARYSQGKLIQEMEKLGLGTKSTRHAIIERLYQVKYVQNEPIEPSKLGRAVIAALGAFAPHITHAEMTSELEGAMDRIAEGLVSKDEVVDGSRRLLNEELDNLMPHLDEIRDALSDAVAADAYVGPCPKCGKDLQMRVAAKTRSMFVGCSGWPDCDVSYPLPKGKVEAVDEPCPTCGMPQIKVTAFRSKPKVMCLDPNCPTNREPDVVVGECPTCRAAGKHHKLVAHKNPRSLKRFVRCENYDECGTSYPLPQYGAITATDEVCEHCGAPIIEIKTQRGPWRLCPDYDCPGKAEAKSAKSKSAGKKSTKSTAKKSTTKKTTARKTSTKKKSE